MKPGKQKVRLIRQRRSFALVCAALCIPCSILGAGLSGYRVNMTPSEPIGIWRILSPGRPVVVGDTVFICLPPKRPDIEQAAQRGYLRSGLCPGGYAPLIKTIAAVAGQLVEIDRTVRIDRVPLARSDLVGLDGKGRPLSPSPGGLVQEGFVFLHSDFVGSYDSRYFGPVPATGILGLAQEVLTIAF